MASRRIQRGVVGLFILGIFVLTFLVLRPILLAIIFGLLFAYIFSPIYRKIKKYILVENISAFILIFGLTILILIPLILLTPRIVNQTFDVYTKIQKFDFHQLLNHFLKPEFANFIAPNIDNIIGKIFSSFLEQFSTLLINLPSFLLKFAVFLFTFFFAIRDSDKLKKYFSDLSPFSASTERKFLREFRGITDAIIFGQVFTGIIQGLALGAGLFLLDVPKALILTTLTCIVSIIPFLGSWLVWLPTALLLIVSGKDFSGIFLLFYGALFVSTIDNIIRPYIISKKSRLPIALSFIGTIGGLYFLGIVGLVLGPLILAYAMIIIELYKQGKLDELFSKR